MMPAADRIVRGPDGVEQHFPSDATDAEISVALNAIPAANAKQAPQAKTWTPMNVLAEGRRSATVKDEQPASRGSQWFDQHLRPMLEAGAHPQTLDEIAQLLVAPVDVTRSVLASAPTAARAASDLVSQARGPVASGLRTTAEVLESPASTALISAGAKQSGLGYVGAVAAGVASRASARVLRFMAKHVEPGPNGTRTFPGYDRYAPSTSGYSSPAAASVPAAEPVAAAGVAPAAASAAPSVGLGLSQLAREGTKLKLSADEMKAGRELIQRGISYDQARDMILRLREVPEAWKKLPTSAEVRKAVSDRNATGRWDQE